MKAVGDAAMWPALHEGALWDGTGELLKVKNCSIQAQSGNLATGAAMPPPAMWGETYGGAF